MNQPVGKGGLVLSLERNHVFGSKGICVMPKDAGIPTKPRVLATSKLTGSDHGSLGSFLDHELSIESRKDLGIPESFTSGYTVAQSLGFKVTNFVN
jgi:hypothetical protein